LPHDRTNAGLVDHGLTVPLSLLSDRCPLAGPASFLFRQTWCFSPLPRGRRCYELARRLRRAVRFVDSDLRADMGHRGGMSHQLQGHQGVSSTEPGTSGSSERTDRANRTPSRDAEHRITVREAGIGGLELVMWPYMRGALRRESRTLHAYYMCPPRTTAVVVISSWRPP